MTDINQILRTLSDADQKIAGLKRKICQKRRELANDESLVQQKQDLFKQAKAKKKSLQLKSRYAEKSLADQENELLKVRELQNNAKSHEEFAAHSRKIQSLEAEVSNLETQVLEMLEALESAEETITDRQRHLSAATEQLESSKTRLCQELKVTKNKLSEAQDKREAALKSLPDKDRELCRRALKVHQDHSIASLGGGVCQGCYVSVRPNDRVSVKAGKHAVVCANCGRVLYL